MLKKTIPLIIYTFEKEARIALKELIIMFIDKNKYPKYVNIFENMSHKSNFNKSNQFKSLFFNSHSDFLSENHPPIL